MANYQWIITFTTTSTTLPVAPPSGTVQSMVASLFSSPTNVWLAGPQSVDDGPAKQAKGPAQVTYQWMITLHTSDTKAPTLSEISSALVTVFGSTVNNVWLAGPQSVDDSP
jgi:hypothetical protein